MTKGNGPVSVENHQLNQSNFIMEIRNLLASSSLPVSLADINEASSYYFLTENSAPLPTGRINIESCSLRLSSPSSADKWSAAHLA